MGVVTVTASHGHFDLLHPKDKSWNVFVRGLKPLLEGVAGVEQFAEREGFSLSIPDFRESEIDGETGIDLLRAALRAQEGWWISSSKKPAACLLAILEDEESTLAAEIERELLESQRDEIQRRVDRELDALGRVNSRLTLTIQFLLERRPAVESTPQPTEET